MDSGILWSDAESVDWSRYTFLDLGASRGGSLAYCSSRFGGKGLGIDIDSAKVHATVASGADALIANAATLSMTDVVSFVSMFDFLEHLPSPAVAEAIVAWAASAARDFLMIRHPSFEGEGTLEATGVYQYWWRWHGHTCHLRVSDYCQMFARLGLPLYRLHYNGPIRSTEDPSCLPVTAAPDSFAYTPDEHGPKPIFDLPSGIWRAQTLFVALRPFGLEEWAALTAKS